MTEEQVKALCKFIVDTSERPLTEEGRELIKQAIDKAKTPQEMVLSALAILSTRKY